MSVAWEVDLPIPHFRWHVAGAQPRWLLRRRTRTNPENLGEPVYPWWRPCGYEVHVAGRQAKWRTVLRVWHNEPGGRDSGEVCRHYTRVQDPVTGQWSFQFHHAWRFHVWHASVQVPVLQDLRRRLLTRCSWCGGRSSRRNGPANVSHQWDRPSGRWWRGEPGLFHFECSAAQNAQRVCACDEPQPYGEAFLTHRLIESGVPVEAARLAPRPEECRTCGRMVPYRSLRQAGQIEVDEPQHPGMDRPSVIRGKQRALQALPRGVRPPRWADLQPAGAGPSPAKAAAR